VFDETLPTDSALQKTSQTTPEVVDKEDIPIAIPEPTGETNHRHRNREVSEDTEMDSEIGGLPLPPIDPSEQDLSVDNSYDLDTIVVRPPGPIPPLRVVPPRADVTAPQRRLRSQEMFRCTTGQALLAITEEPLTLQEALADPDAAAWKRAWESELESLHKNHTWVICKLPKDRNIVGCRWLFRKKDDGRYKVRLVAKGYSQTPGIDFNETFAPVAKFTTIRVLLALVAENDWELHSMDVKTAFLNGELEEEVYMECPEGIKDDEQPDSVCRLVKAIYGLRQSPRAWYQKIHTFFTDHAFIRSTQDYSLYIHYGRKVIALVYVDDLVLAAAKIEDISWIKTTLAQAFEMTDLGKLKVFLGLEIRRDRSQLLLSISQQRYIDRILERHGMQDSRPSLTPLDPNTRLRSDPIGESSLHDTQHISLEVYQSAVGSLMYAMLGTRPDIAYSVGLVSQFSHTPEPAHWIAVKRIFRYLVATRHYVLQYGLNNNTGGYSDADWGAGHDRKSIGGFVFLMDGGAISWASKKQSSIALSTTEAEYMAMTQATKEIMWLRILLDEIGAFKHIGSISQLHADNQGAIALARNPEYHARTKHIDIQYHFIRHQVTAEKIHLRYCTSSNMVADIMTKALPRVAHQKHMLAMGIIEGHRYGTLREGAC